MLSEAEARAQVLRQVVALSIEDVPCAAALGRVTADRLIATIALPGFDNSQVDGYGLRASEAQRGASLQVIAEQAAGLDAHHAWQVGTAIRIFTGAPIPAGVDAVIMQEDVTRSGDRIEIKEEVAIGDFIRRAGSDLAAGQIIATPGSIVTPAFIGVLASQGIASLRAHRLPRVAVLTTGDELVAPGQPLLPGQLYNSNGPMLCALLRQLGVAQSTHRHCADRLADTVTAIAELLATHDTVIIAGGVSVGDHDHVKPALQQLGIAPDLWRVKVKPGKPFLFATQPGEPAKHVFGLPGNPVSAFVTFQLFVRPALLAMMGHHGDALELASYPGALAAEIHNDGDRPHYVRGVFQRGTFRAEGLQQSHALHGLSRCNAMLRVPEHTTFAAGSQQPVHLT